MNSLFAYFATNLGRQVDPGIRGNEIWNGAFPAYRLATTQSYRNLLALGGSAWSLTNTGGVTDSDFTWGACHGAAHCHALARAAFVAAGRPATDVIRVISGQGGNPGVTTALAAAMNAVPGAPGFDRFAISSYLPNLLPISGAPGYATFASDATITPGQELDQWEAIIASGYYHTLTVASSRGPLDSAGFAGVALMEYEASLDEPAAGDNAQDGLYVSGAILRHPRAYRLQLANLQASQAAGSVLHQQFYFGSGTFFSQGGVSYGWTTFFGSNQGLGTGASGENSDPFGPHPLSQSGGAINTWAGLVAGTPPPPPSSIAAILAFRIPGTFS